MNENGYKFAVGDIIELIKRLPDISTNEFDGIPVGSVGVITGFVNYFYDETDKYNYIVEWNKRFGSGYKMYDEYGRQLTSDFHGWKVQETYIALKSNINDDIEEEIRVNDEELSSFIC